MLSNLNTYKCTYLKLMKTFLVHNNVMVFHLMMQVKIEHVSSFKVEEVKLKEVEVI